MIEIWHKYESGGRQVFYRDGGQLGVVEGNVKDGFVSMATVEGRPPSDKVQSKEQPTRAVVEEHFASYVRAAEN